MEDILNDIATLSRTAPPKEVESLTTILLELRARWCAPPKYEPGYLDALMEAAEGYFMASEIWTREQ
jgi:hypothetical protein